MHLQWISIINCFIFHLQHPIINTLARPYSDFSIRTWKGSPRKYVTKSCDQIWPIQVPTNVSSSPQAAINRVIQHSLTDSDAHVFFYSRNMTFTFVGRENPKLFLPRWGGGLIVSCRDHSLITAGQSAAEEEAGFPKRNKSLKKEKLARLLACDYRETAYHQNEKSRQFWSREISWDLVPRDLVTPLHLPSNSIFWRREAQFL